MQLSTLLLALMASLAIAVPTGGGGGDDGDCGCDDGGGGGDGGGTFDPCRETLLNAQPQCCAATVGDVADLTCATVSTQPTSAENFRDICAETGLSARCCTVSVLGVSLLCAKPVGIA